MKTEMSCKTNEEHQFQLDLQGICMTDVNTLIAKGREYGDSWKRRGGVGAFMMLARKWDRIEALMEKTGYDIFEAIAQDKRDEGILGDIRDLRCYLLLVEQHMVCPVYVENPGCTKEEFEIPLKTSQDPMMSAAYMVGSIPLTLDQRVIRQAELRKRITEKLGGPTTPELMADILEEQGLRERLHKKGAGLQAAQDAGEALLDRGNRFKIQDAKEISDPDEYLENEEGGETLLDQEAQDFSDPYLAIQIRMNLNAKEWPRDRIKTVVINSILQEGQIDA